MGETFVFQFSHDTPFLIVAVGLDQLFAIQSEAVQPPPPKDVTDPEPDKPAPLSPILKKNGLRTLRIQMASGFAQLRRNARIMKAPQDHHPQAAMEKEPEDAEEEQQKEEEQEDEAEEEEDDKDEEDEEEEDEEEEDEEEEHEEEEDEEEEDEEEEDEEEEESKQEDEDSDDVEEDMDVILVPVPDPSCFGSQRYHLRHGSKVARRPTRSAAQSLKELTQTESPILTTDDQPVTDPHRWTFAGEEVSVIANADPAPQQSHTLRHRNEKVYEFVTVQTISKTKSEMYSQWKLDRSRRFLPTTLSYSSFCKVTRHRFQAPRSKTDMCDHCVNFQDWDRDRDKEHATQEDKDQLEAYEEHHKEFTEQRHRFNENLEQLQTGECRITVDFAEKLRLPQTMVQKGRQFYSFQLVSCITFVVQWKSGDGPHSLSQFTVHS
jgi:hypothetical protein